MDTFLRVKAEERKPMEGIEVVTDNGKMYYFEKEKWGVWNHHKQNYDFNVNQPFYWFEAVVPKT